MSTPYESPESDLTVSQTEQEYQYVGFWKRLIAYFIDGIIVTILSLPGYFIFGFESVLAMIVGLVIAVGYYIVLWHKSGSTPGKNVISAKVVCAKTGQYPTLGQAALRYLGYIVSSIPLGLGFVIAAFTKKKQGLHDMISGTVVIKNSTLPNQPLTE